MICMGRIENAVVSEVLALFDNCRNYRKLSYFYAF